MIAFLVDSIIIPFFLGLFYSNLQYGGRWQTWMEQGIT